MLTLSVGAIILDNPNATITGGWSNLVGLQCFGTNSLIHAQGFGDSKVQYSGAVPKSGSYRVYEWNPAALNHSGSVPLAVETAAGTTFLNFSQSLSAGTWVLVGTFPFTTNSPARLTIYDNCPDAGRLVIADAFRLLYAPAPPTFVSQPANQTIDCGQPAAFSAQATGTQPMAFQWQKNGINIKDATNSTLNLPSVALWDAGSYALLLANADGTTISQSAQLSVTAPHLNAYASQDHLVMEWSELEFFRPLRTSWDPMLTCQML